MTHLTDSDIKELATHVLIADGEELTDAYDLDSEHQNLQVFLADDDGSPVGNIWTFGRNSYQRAEEFAHSLASKWNIKEVAWN